MSVDPHAYKEVQLYFHDQGKSKYFISLRLLFLELPKSIFGRGKSGVMSLFNISLSSHVFKLSSQPAELSFASAVRMKKLWDLANNTGTVVGTCGRCSVAT